MVWVVIIAVAVAGFQMGRWYDKAFWPAEEPCPFPDECTTCDPGYVLPKVHTRVISTAGPVIGIS